jgi:hypothetical protein
LCWHGCKTSAPPERLIATILRTNAVSFAVAEEGNPGLRVRCERFDLRASAADQQQCVVFENGDMICIDVSTTKTPPARGWSSRLLRWWIFLRKDDGTSVFMPVRRRPQCFIGTAIPGPAESPDTIVNI